MSYIDYYVDINSGQRQDIKNNCLKILNIIVLASRKVYFSLSDCIRYVYDLTSCNIGCELDTNSRHESYL